MTDPWFKFYPSDWRQDPALRMCSLGARGLWIELIALMHQSTPYGHLLVSGQSPTDTQLAMLVGCPSEQITQFLGELEAAGVFSRTRSGVIFSRKMSRMQKKAATARNNGQKGGNPTLCNERENKPSDNPEVKGGVKPQKLEARSQIDKEANASSAEQAAVDAYNATASECGWPKVQRMTKPRLSALKARLRDAGGLDGWSHALERARNSDFLCGRRPGRDGPFFASFDFLTQASSFTRLMEGTYDNRTRAQFPAGGPEHRPDPALEQIARLARLGTASGHGRA